MSKLSKEEIEQTLAEKEYKLVDYDQYQNLNSVIDVICRNGHQIKSTMKVLRKASFVCPKCEGGHYEMRKDGRPPEKKGQRVIGIDNATKKMGVSVFDGNELVYYTIFNFTSDVLEERLLRIYRLMTEVIIPDWQPDFVVLEDIQMQNKQYVAFKALAMLLGIMTVTLEDFGISYAVIKSSVWRSAFSIRGKVRSNQKIQAMKKVKEMYNIIVTDDAAEAILIGKYAVKKLNAKKRETVF
jgi:Holliday junction resolvasome RuvABC endonuclease subunit